MSEANTPWSKEEFEQKLREKSKFYHRNHEFHILMNEGKLDKKAVQGWVANRFYYQVAIPVKDAAIMANCWDREVRRHWIQRIIDHDGNEEDSGGIQAWLLFCLTDFGFWAGQVWQCFSPVPGIQRAGFHRRAYRRY